MTDNQLAELKDAMHMLARHLRGEKVAGVRVSEVPEPDVKAIREAVNVSQSDLADAQTVVKAASACKQAIRHR